MRHTTPAGGSHSGPARAAGRQERQICIYAIQDILPSNTTVFYQYYADWSMHDTSSEGKMKTKITHVYTLFPTLLHRA